MQPLPFLVGRQANADLVLASGAVSHRHAQLDIAGSSLSLLDLRSTNGTFVNGQRVHEETVLSNGDVLHFADQEFRLIVMVGDPLSVSSPTLQFRSFEPTPHLALSREELFGLIESRAVAPAFQPIVSLNSRRVVAYEALGRANSGAMQLLPSELFEAASTFGLEGVLSQLMRSRAVELAPRLPGFEGRTAGAGPRIFLNTHPSELGHLDVLVASLRPLAESAGDVRLVLEIHEAAVTNPQAMRRLKTELQALGMGLAYDDFGAGQARFLHLAEVPPEFLKFDRSMIENLDRAPQGRQLLLDSVVSACAELGIQTLAEGIERPEEAEAARKLGFDLGQGYFFGGAEPVAGG